MSIEGIPEGWELVRIGEVQHGDFFILSDGLIEQHDEDKVLRMNKNYVIIRKIEKPKEFRPFANAAEYMPNWGKPVDWKLNDVPCLCAVVCANDGYLWVTFGYTVRCFSWEEAFKAIWFADGTPFGVEVTE